MGTQSTMEGKDDGYSTPTPGVGPTRIIDPQIMVEMPPLAGKPLMTPHLYPVAWEEERIFEEVEDPDRTTEPWPLPSFLTSKDPIEQRRRVKVTELAVPDGAAWQNNGGEVSFARVIDNVLEPEECAELLAKVNAQGFTPDLLNIGRGRQQLVSEVRDGHRAIVDSPELSGYLMEVIRGAMPEWLDGYHNGREYVEGLNERCRFLCYTPGQAFEAHCDGCYQRRSPHPKAGDKSRVTVQLYLHDVPEAHGGATTFLGDRATRLPCQPRCGSVLLFTQDLMHEGSLVTAGIKYTMRTEVMYTTKPPNAAAHVPVES